MSSSWSKIAGNGALYGMHEMGKKTRRKKRVPRSKADASGPGIVKKKYNKRREKAEVKHIDPTGYTPQTKNGHTPGELFEAQAAAPVLPRHNNKTK